MQAAASKSHNAAPAESRAALLLAWYDRHARVLPWRVSPSEYAAGEMPDPYRVWLSEIMLQQTTVEAVKPYFAKFIERWPNVSALAAAHVDDVMRAWAGLGYYSRARNLKKCADVIVAERGGRFPEKFDELLKLPGIGRYTAAAIAAIAFDRFEPVVDGNVERVTSRLFAISTQLPAAKAEITESVRAMLPPDRPGDFAQAMMDLGATICTPRRPACLPCPLNADCAAFKAGDPELYPVKPAKAERPARRGAAFVAVRSDGAVILRKRPDSGLLGGMAEVPTTGWSARVDGDTHADAAPFAADWRRAGTAAHVFTHFSLELTVYRADVGAMPAPAAHWWSAPDDLMGEALPTVMKKVIEAAIPGATRKKAPQIFMTEIRHIVFDIGRVLIHYDPEIPFKRIIPDAEKRRWFFENVCTHEWNLEQDRGRPIVEAEALLIAEYPDHEDNIRAFYGNWHEMVSHAYDDSVAIMTTLMADGHDVTMLTNFSAETFVDARRIFPFLDLPRGVSVSGELGLIKPDRAIYDHHASTFGLEPAATLFIDDSQKNVDGAIEAGWNAVLFTGADRLKADLAGFGIRA